MSIEVLKKELAGLPPKERSQVMGYLVTLQDEGDADYRAKLAEKIDNTDPRRWIDLDELERRAGGKG